MNTTKSKTIVLTNSDVQRGIIRTASIRDLLGKDIYGKVYVACGKHSNERKNIPQLQKRYIDGLGNIHKENNAKEGTKVTITKTSDKHYLLVYNSIEQNMATNDQSFEEPMNTTPKVQQSFEEINDMPTQTKQTNAMIDKSILDAFIEMGRRYYQMLSKGFIPTRGTIGFTERNLTYNFCRIYQELNNEAYVWLELPTFNDHQHLDAIIVDKKDAEINFYYIESKRIYNESYIDGKKSSSSLLKDYDRLMKRDYFHNINSFDKLVEGYNPSSIHRHIVLLASLEFMSINLEKTYKGRFEGINDFARNKGMQIHQYNLREGYNVKENERDTKLNSICTIDGEQLVNMHLYIMTKTIDK